MVYKPMTTKIEFFKINDRLYKQIKKPTGSYMLVPDPENGQDEVEMWAHNVEEVSKAEYEKFS